MGNCATSDSHVMVDGLPTEQSRRSKFNPFYDTNNQNNSQKQILGQYKFHSTYDDKFLGRCSILQHKVSHDFFLQKQIQLNNQTQYSKKLQQFLSIQQKLTNQNIIQIKHIIEKETDGFFTQKKKIILIVDYPLTNLQKEYSSRLINQLEFSKEQIVNLIIAGIKGYAEIQRCRNNSNHSSNSNSSNNLNDIFKNDKIRLKNIFFGIKSRNTLIKVAESSLLNEKSNLQLIFDDQHDCSENYDIYLAPQQFNAYLNRNKKDTFQKAGVFSFGMSILDMCLMTSSRQSYHYDQKRMDFNAIRNRVFIAGKKFGTIVQRFLQDMLISDDKVRFSFNDLQSKIPSLLVTKTLNEGSRMNLSVARSTSSYLRNDPKVIRPLSRSGKQNSVYRPRSVSLQSSMNRSKSNNSSISINSRYNSKFGQRIRGPQQQSQSQQLQRVHQIYDKSIGREYIGQKKSNLKHGLGKYIFQSNGSYYQGQWRFNKMQGKGQSYFKPNQLQYSGQWKSDQYHGWGILYSNDSNWISYQGQFKNGVKQGRALLRFSNGVIYDGEFRGDKIHGRGKVLKNGNVIKEQFWDSVSIGSFLNDNKF